jgi:pSer/pThr/pTyr-binding forkhead associated (FHA) protein
VTGKYEDFAPGGDVRAYLRTQSGHRIELLPNRVYVVGRAETCDIQIDDAGCSRKHARISVAGDARTISVEDLGSKNGTALNGDRLDRAQLKDGDSLCFGETTFQVHIWDRPTDVSLETRTSFFGQD